MENLAKKCKQSFYKISQADSILKNNILKSIKKGLLNNIEKIINENDKDIINGKKKKLNNALLDRLKLDEQRIKKIADSIDEIVNLTDPVGEISDIKVRPNGLRIGQMRAPIGSIFIIYEARPNVTIDAAALCIKSGNACILKGGSESINSNRILSKIIQNALKENGMDINVVSFVDTTDREKVNQLLTMDNYIDLVIPRGGEGLIRAVVKNSSIPVIKHYKGVCHTYIDKDYDKKIVYDIVYNAKVQRPGVCNAMETLLVHKSIAKKVLPKIKKQLEKAGVKLYGCSKTRKIIKIYQAKSKDWTTEYLDLKLSIKIVDSLEDAVEHINNYGSRHSECIITENYYNAEKFLREVDSAAVFVNASTRFSDGNEFGLGAEIGISTDKLHARGPMGVKELTTLKFVVYGNGQIRN